MIKRAPIASLLVIAAATGFIVPAAAQEKAEEKSEEAKPESVSPPVRMTREPLPQPTYVAPPRVAAPPIPPPPAPPAPNLSRPATPKNQARWARRFDYPEGAAFLGEEGRTGLYVKVGANGRAFDCIVTYSSGFASLDKRACHAMLRYSRFDPALDRQGEPTVASYSVPIMWRSNDSGDEFSAKRLRWKRPDLTSAHARSSRVGVAFDIEPDGSIARCAVTRSSGSAVLDAETCTNIKQLKGSKAVAVHGVKPTTRSVRRTIDWGRLPKAERVEGNAVEGAALDVDAAVAVVPPPPSPSPPPRPVLRDGDDGPEPIGSPRDWITDADYPLDAWRADEKGTVRYELAVNETGGVTDCSVTYSSASPRLDATTCRLLRQRARFNPTRDEDGNAVASTYFNDFYWRKRQPEFPSSFTIKVGYIVNDQGEVEDCEVLEVSDTLPEQLARSFEREPCPTRSGAIVAPYRDENGVPVRRKVTVTFDTVVEAPAAPTTGD